MGDAAMTKRHVEGAARMVELKGGPQTLGMNGFLAMLLAKYSQEVGLSTEALSFTHPGPGSVESST